MAEIKEAFERGARMKAWLVLASSLMAALSIGVVLLGKAFFDNIETKNSTLLSASWAIATAGVGLLFSVRAFRTKRAFAYKIPWLLEITVGFLFCMIGAYFALLGRYPHQERRIFLCVGSYPDLCIAESLRLPCGTDVEAWLTESYRKKCPDWKVDRLMSTSGGQCGVANFEVQCLHEE